jgi:BlaI family penicillinase repressor
MKRIPQISAAEWRIMKVIWKKSPLSAQAVIEAVQPETGWSSATIKTLINRLVKKRALGFRVAGRAYLYFPAVEEEVCQRVEAASFLEKIFDGAVTPMLAHFVQQARLSSREIRELEEILKRKDQP